VFVADFARKSRVGFMESGTFFFVFPECLFSSFFRPFFEFFSTFLCFGCGEAVWMCVAIMYIHVSESIGEAGG